MSDSTSDEGYCPWCDKNFPSLWTTAAFVVRNGRMLAPARNLDDVTALPDGLYAHCPSCKAAFALEPKVDEALKARLIQLAQGRNHP